MRAFGRVRRLSSLIIMVALTACQGDGDPEPTLTATVTVSNNAFSPASVTILRTGTVTWNWTAGPHNVTFSDANSGNRASGETFARTFNSTGSFSYQCTLHPGIMAGTVVVQ